MIGSEKESKLLSLLPKSCVFGVPIFTIIADFEFDDSRNFIAELKKNITTDRNIHHQYKEVEAV